MKHIKPFIVNDFGLKNSDSEILIENYLTQKLPLLGFVINDVSLLDCSFMDDCINKLFDIEMEMQNININEMKF